MMDEYRIELHGADGPLECSEGIYCEPGSLEEMARTVMEMHPEAESATVTRLDDTGEAWLLDTANGFRKTKGLHARQNGEAK